MTCPTSRKGSCRDNAPAESWFNSFKNERTHGRRFATRAQMGAEGFEYIEVFYNHKRMHSTLDYKTPTQFLQDWISNQEKQKQVHEAHLLEDEKPREAHFCRRWQITHKQKPRVRISDNYSRELSLSNGAGF